MTANRAGETGFTTGLATQGIGSPNRPLDQWCLPPQSWPVKYANLALLILYPVAWFAPLMRAALLPMFGMTEISVITGLQSLWQSDAGLALLVTFLAVFVPYAKTIGLALVQFGLLDAKVMPVLHGLGRLAMADVFLAALYIVLVKGVGHATVEVAWGLWLFTGCVLASLAMGWAERRVV